jgi:DNA-binding MarR family transcriptional regulator
MYKDLDPLIHQPLRLAIMSILVSVASAEFNYLKEKTQSTQGNLSIQLKKLKEADYIEIEKSFRDNYPLTTCKITKTGISAFEAYVNTISGILKK